MGGLKNNREFPRERHGAVGPQWYQVESSTDWKEGREDGIVRLGKPGGGPI